MRILFAIALVALAALLWASVSIGQHIYRARRSRRQTPMEPHLEDLQKDLQEDLPNTSSTPPDTSSHAPSPLGPVSSRLHDESIQHRKAS